MVGQSLGGSGYVYLVPYAVAFISLENVLVITRSIVSTPAHLDIKAAFYYSALGPRSHV